MVNQIEGIHTLLSREKMHHSAIKLRDTYNCKQNAPFYHEEFGFMTLDHWLKQGYLKSIPSNSWEPDAYIRKIFMFDEPGRYELKNLGWTESEFFPLFEEKLIEDHGDKEIVQDASGRYVLYFKGRRSGFMPEYVDHPAKDMKTWEEQCKWRLDPNNSERIESIKQVISTAISEARQGKFIVQRVVGGYMYLRSLIGPEGLLYMFYDNPTLIHDCMETWFNLADFVIAEHQKHVTIDELFFGEDICYNHGPLISPNMINEFLIPYYQQLVTNMKKRQLDPNRHLYVQIDTDGYLEPVVEIYKQIGMDVMSPFEVASGCDVVEMGKKYPELIMTGGIDKRVLATTKDEINRYLDGILPIMRSRGGYIPTCDHGVPEEVTFENYMHYRQRCIEYSK